MEVKKEQGTQTNLKKEEQNMENKTLVEATASETAVQETAVVEEKKGAEPEAKKEEKPANVEPTETEKTFAAIKSLVAKNPGLKIVESESKTGYSFFSGKKRLCKLLKTKRGVTLEINVQLPQQFKDLAEMENISASTAFKKHLGTMKHLYRGSDAKLIPSIMKEAIAVFKAELEAAKKQEEAPEKKASNQ